MWPFKNKKTRQEFVQEFTRAIAQTWLDIPHITALFPDNLASFRFVFSSYTLALIYHEFERGESANADLQILTDAFPRSNEPQVISKVLIDPHDLWYFAENVRIISGFKEFPDEFSDLELPPNIIMLCIYFIRSAHLRGWLDRSGENCENRSKITTEDIFIASGVHLVNHVFTDTLMASKSPQEYGSMTLERSAVMREYSRTLYSAVLPVSKKFH